MKCEICGKEIVGKLSFLKLFGQKACSEACMIILAKKQKKEVANKLTDNN
jgi:predicted nucleic acid-binding Zn ribbon protein